jgi:hypothetical protein
LNFNTTASHDSSRKVLAAVVSVLIFVVGAYAFSALVLSGELMGFAYVDLLGLGAIFIIAILRNWRNGVYLFYLAGSSKSELQHRTWEYPLQSFLGAFNYDRWPYGYGTGTSSLGVQYVAKIFHRAPMGIGVESGFGSVVLEMGIGGLFCGSA